MAHPGYEPEPLISPVAVASLVLLGLLVLTAVWLRTGVIGGEHWPIRWLEVEGELNRTSTDQIRAAVAPHTPYGFFAVDMTRTRMEVEALPWVARAEVSRHWPDALRVRVIEHRPVARWNETALVSDTGRAFDVAGSSGMQGLPNLIGPEGRLSEVLDAWRDFRARLGMVGLDVVSVRLDARGSWQIELADGPLLYLGRELVDERLERFLAVHESLMHTERRALEVDLRYTNGLAVRWAEPDQGSNPKHG